MWDDHINLFCDNEFRENQAEKVYITFTGVKLHLCVFRKALWYMESKERFRKFRIVRHRICGLQSCCHPWDTFVMFACRHKTTVVLWQYNFFKPRYAVTLSWDVSSAFYNYWGERKDCGKWCICRKIYVHFSLQLLHKTLFGPINIYRL